MNTKRLAELSYLLQKLIDDPGDCDVGEYDALQREYNNLLMQQEAERNINNTKNAERRRAMMQEQRINLKNNEL